MDFAQFKRLDVVEKSCTVAGIPTTGDRRVAKGRPRTPPCRRLPQYRDRGEIWLAQREPPTWPKGRGEVAKHFGTCREVHQQVSGVDEIERSGKWFGQQVEATHFDGTAGERFE